MFQNSCVDADIKALKKILMLTVECLSWKKWVVSASCVVFICGYSLSLNKSSEMFSDFKLHEHYYILNVCDMMVFKYNKFTVKGMTMNSVPGNMKTRSGPQIKYFIPA